jgi:hypothetical protein
VLNTIKVFFALKDPYFDRVKITDVEYLSDLEDVFNKCDSFIFGVSLERNKVVSFDDRDMKNPKNICTLTPCDGPSYWCGYTHEEEKFEVHIYKPDAERLPIDLIKSNIKDHCNAVFSLLPKEDQ